MSRSGACAARAAAALLAVAFLGGCARSTSMPRVAPPEHGAPARMDSAELRALWNFSDPVASERAFRARAAEASDPERAELETQVARSLGLQGRFEEANALLDRIEARLPGPPDVVRVRLLLERGRCLNSGGAAERARPLFIDGWDRARAAGLDDLAVDAAHMVAITEAGADALDWNLRALGLANGSADPQARRWRTSLFNNIAWTYHDLGDFPRALDFFQQALAEARTGSDAEVTRIAEWSVGRVLRSLGRFEEALAVQRHVEAEYAAAGANDDGSVSEEIAENLLALGRASEATPCFARAHERLAADESLRKSEPARLERLRTLGAVATP